MPSSPTPPVVVVVIAFFLDFFEIAFIIIPLLVPVAHKLDINIVWFGVLICAETNRHEELVLAAATAKKHMFVEKPLGIGAEDANRMAAAIEEMIQTRKPAAVKEQGSDQQLSDAGRSLRRGRRTSLRP